jgi:hypothetical protein
MLVVAISIELRRKLWNGQQTSRGGKIYVLLNT